MSFAQYQEAQPHLLDRLGWYCSYCERPIENGPSVDHIRPKVHHPALERTWCNLLLACCNCNPTKGAKDVRLDEHFWPDADNTARAFDYSALGPSPREDLPADQRDRARRTLELTGLDRRPGRAREPSDADHRWRKREEAWKKAQMARDVLRCARSEGVLSITVELAVATGFWSIWMTVFEDDPEVRARLIRAFPGTAADCFDAATRPTRRPGGAV